MPSEISDGPSLMCHYLLQELFGTLVFRIGKKFFRRFIFQNLAFIDKNHTVGDFAMGGMMYKTGLSQWVGDKIVGMLGGDPSEFALVAIFCVMALLLSELTSHTAATNMIGPLGITAAVAAGFSPVHVAVGIALSSSLGFMLPVSTPPNAIVYASGYIPITKMIKTGVYIDFIGIFCVTIPLVLYFVTWIVG